MTKRRSIVLIAHNLRSCHNVGSLLRTAEGLGVSKVILTGYTPYPMSDNDNRLPHLAKKTHKQIQKTALGAEATQPWEHEQDINKALAGLKADQFITYALEQTDTAVPLTEFKPPQKLALLVGQEVEGIEIEVIAASDGAIEIPMFGQKESFNVAQAAAMALYHCTFM